MCRCRVALTFGALVLAVEDGRLDSPASVAGWLVALLVSLSWHESAHAWVASRLGDHTGRLLGRVTLNPIPHIDPIGTLLLPLILYLTHSSVLFGWAKPVPVNPFNLRRPVLGMALVAGAGPLSNVILAFLFAVILGLVARNPDLTRNAGFEMLKAFVQLNAVLAVFNLLPVPPLDGSKVVAAFLPSEARESYLRLEMFGMVIVILLMSTGFLRRITGPPLTALYDVLDRTAVAVRG